MIKVNRFLLLIKKLHFRDLKKCNFFKWVNDNNNAEVVFPNKMKDTLE